MILKALHQFKPFAENCRIVQFPQIRIYEHHSTDDIDLLSNNKGGWNTEEWLLEGSPPWRPKDQTSWT